MTAGALDKLRELPGFRATGKNQWEARCPGHEDRKASLGISIGADDRILLHCFANCDLARILDGAGLSERDLFAPKGNGAGHHEKKIVASYDYQDQAGNLVYQVVRFEPKDFRQRRPDGNGGWTWKLNGIPRVPYRLPELARATDIFIVEGEKDAVTLHKIGLTATCNSGGAGKWTAELSKHFRSDQHVTILPDNDEPGKKHAQQVAASLHGTVASVKILDLAGLPAKGDVSDWLRGRDQAEAAEALCQMSDAAPEWTPSQAAATSGVATDPAAEFPQTDSGNAELFASLNAGRVLFDHRRGQWLLWGAHCWEPDRDGQLYRFAKEAARERYRRAEAIEDLSARGRESKWAVGSESRQKLEAALGLAKCESDLADSGDSWNRDPFLLAVGNGVIDLRTGELRAGRPEDRISFHSRVKFDPAATCPRWLRFLNEVFEANAELIDFVHRGVGYSICGDTREQILFVCFGAGANGKGILLNSLRKILGDYGHNMPFSTLEQQDRGGIPNDLAALVGRRFVTASETNQSARLNEARVKALTGCDPISARFLHGEWFTFQPVAKFWLAVNHRPRVSDNGFGFWRRVRIIPFLRQFTGNSVDLRLDEKLETEFPGILAWAVRGCLDWQARGLDAPACVRDATDEYRQDSDILSEFITERCTTDPCRSASGGDLFKAYRAWAEGHGLREKETLGQREFGRRMAEKFTKHRITSGVFYEGVGLSM